MTAPAPRPVPTAGTATTAVVAWLRSWVDEGADRPPLVVATSGSTGAPKRVVLGAPALDASARATADRLGGEATWLLALPAAGIAGLQVVLRSLLAGLEPVDVTAAGSWEAAVARAERSGAGVHVSLVPTQLRRLLEATREAGGPAARELAALARCQAVLLGGGPVEQSLREEAAGHGITTVATYGMSETCGGCVYDGLGLDGVQVRVAQDDRVLLSGPVLFDGYLDDPGLTADVLQEGWFRTPDVGRLGADGRLELLGRADDVVVSGGVNVPGGAVARRLRAHPGVREALVLGLDDPEWGRRVVAVLETVDGGELDLAEVREWVAVEQPRAWAPQEVRHLDAVPLLGSGKPDRLAVLRWLGASAGSPA